MKILRTIKLLFFGLHSFEKNLDMLYDMQVKYTRETFRHLHKRDFGSAEQSYGHWMSVRERINEECNRVVGMAPWDVVPFEVWLEDIFKVR